MMIVRFLASLLFSAAVLSASAVTVPEYAYTGDMSMTAVDRSVTAIGEGAYAGSGLTTASLPSGITEIGAYAFADCRSLVSAEIPEGVTTLSAGLFRGCTSLREISLPSTLETVECGAFAATALESVDFSRCTRLRSIGERCFADCRSLTGVRLPANLTHIGNSAFFGCVSLKELPLPDALQSIGDCSLACVTSISVMRLPASLGYIGSNAMERMDCLSGIDATWVKEVPALGNEVWHGLPQHHIWLSVAPKLHNCFAASPQWRDFNITAGTVSTLSPSTEAAEIKSRITYRVSEVEITVTTFTDGSRRVEKTLKTN